MVSVELDNSGRRGCSRLGVVKGHDLYEARLCRHRVFPHNTRTACDTAELTLGWPLPAVRTDDGGSTAHLQGMKRKGAACSGSGPRAVPGTPCSTCPGPKGRGVTPQILSAQISSGLKGKVSLEAGGVAEMGVQSAVTFAECCGARASECKQRGSSSSGSGTKGDSDSVSRSVRCGYETAL